MELLNLHYFMSVMKYKNFTKAARAMFTSQSNISKQIFQLEEELEVTLFFRTNIGVEPTPAGEVLYEGLSKLIPELEHLVSKTKDIYDGTAKGIIRLGLYESMDLERIIPSFFNKLFNNIDLDIQVRIETYDFNKLLEKLAIQDLDCVFYFSVLKASVPNLNRMALSRANPMIYFSERYPIYRKQNILVEDFSEATFVRCISKLEIGNQYNVLPFEPKKIIEVNSLNAAFIYIDPGKAVGVFGPSQNILSKNNISTIEIPTTEKVGTDVLWMSNNSNPAIGPFLEFLKKYST